jgi:oligoribonuclease
MAVDQNNLVWLDMEMTGLEPERERIIELAMVVTNANLDILAQSPEWVVHQPDTVLDAMDNWNKSTHGKSGLIDRVKASAMRETDVEAQAVDFLKQWVPAKTSPLCGNSVHQDRRFMVLYMPQLEGFFHYRNLDVSTLKELARRWRPEVAKSFLKRSAHTALADVQESIDELKHYREHFLRMA